MLGIHAFANWGWGFVGFAIIIAVDAHCKKKASTSDPNMKKSYQPNLCSVSNCHPKKRSESCGQDYLVLILDNNL